MPKLKFKIIINFLVIFFGLFCFAKISWAACTGSSPIWTSTPDYPSVNSCVSSASEGDTINVGAGNATWDYTLAITKGLTLQGAGMGSTNITSNVGDHNFLLTYNPAVPTNNAAFTVTGFTFDINSNSMTMQLANSDAAHPVTKVRIHHNEFLNVKCQDVGPTHVAFEIYGGSVWGVFDNNKVTGYWVVHTDSNQGGNWLNTTFDPGSGKNFYFEDNDITAATCPMHAAASPTTGSGWGGRYAFRYNTFHYTNGTGLYPWFDVHGNQPSGVFGPMGAEIYGNLLESTGFSDVNGINAFSIRGGKNIIFNNNIRALDANEGHRIGAVGFSLLEEYPDNYNVGVTELYSCSGSVEGKSCASDGETQHINSSYFWNNRYDNYQGTNRLLFPSLDIDCSLGVGGYGPYPDCEYHGHGVAAILENSDWWQQSESFNGSSGVGCGTLSSRPSICTTGVGYWATNQSCSSVADANIGKNPAAPISGTLYKCTSSNTWTAYYIPYTYPHPLRAIDNVDTTPPAAPTGLIIN